MNITTSNFNVVPDFYNSKDECIQSMNLIKKQTNNRYKNFTQSIWTAGDIEQFETYKYSSNNNTEKFEIEVNEENLFKNYNINIWEKYISLQSEDVLNTFKYIFYKFKKGIFVKIVNNQLKVFLPFSNVNYINEWSNHINIDKTKYKDFNDFLKHIYDMENRHFIPSSVNKYINTWYANDFLLRHEYPIKENDTNVSVIKNMLEELCLERKLPDIEFFINKRDLPIIKRNSTEPYHNIWDSENKPLVSHNYNKYSPILSMVSSDKFADILFPTTEDWVRIQSKNNKWFQNNCREYNDIFSTPWKNKKPTAVFRGSSTGIGVTIETNPRLHIAYLSHKMKLDNNQSNLIDAGITKWNLRVRKISGEKYLKTIDINTLPFTLVESLTPQQQSQYKYIIHIDGHVSAYRLSLELNMGSVILLVDSKWNTWYKKLLIPYIHFVPIKNDLSDIIEKIQWCRNNDDKCIEIVNNAKHFYNKYLQKNGVFDYLQNLLCSLKKNIGHYNYYDISPLEIQYKNQEKQIYSICENTYPKTSKTISDINFQHYLNLYKRDYSLLEAIRLVINMINKTSNIELLASEKEEIFKNKLDTIQKINFKNFFFIVKSTNQRNKIIENIHETFVGLKCTNELLKYIPNFAFIFGTYKHNNNTNIISEYIDGISLYDFIKSKSFNMHEFIFIILQLSLSLQVAQNKFAFIHYDITPWNIIIKKTSTHELVEYPITYKNIIKIKTNIIPIIIDYGKSHVIYNNTHYGIIDIFNMNMSHDIISLLITSIHNIFIYQKNLKPKDINSLIYLCNFFSNSEYYKYKFNNAKQIINFLHFSHKYSNIIYYKNINIHKKPIDLFYYIMKNFKYNSINYSETLVNSYPINNSLQTFEYLLSDNDTKKISSFLQVFNKIQKYKHIYTSTNVIFIYYLFQYLDYHIDYVWNNLNILLQHLNYKIIPYNKMYSKVKHHIKNYFVKNVKQSLNIFPDFNLTITNQIINNNYTLLQTVNLSNNIFLQQNTIQYIYNHLQPIIEVTEFKDICECVLYNTNRFKINNKIKLSIENEILDLLNFDDTTLLNNNSIIHTLKKYIDFYIKK